MDPISEIEDAIVAVLKTGMPYLRTCDSLSEFMALDLEELKELTPLLPAAYVVYEKGRYQHYTGAQDKDLIFNVILMAQNLRGDKAARHGRGSEIGVYRMLDDTRQALFDNNCGIDIDALLPIDEQALMGDGSTVVYGMAFKTRRRFQEEG